MRTEFLFSVVQSRLTAEQGGHDLPLEQYGESVTVEPCVAHSKILFNGRGASLDMVYLTAVLEAMHVKLQAVTWGSLKHTIRDDHSPPLIECYRVARCLSVEFQKSLITIDPNQTDDDYRSTLLHEITHVGLDFFGLGSDDEMPQINNEYLTEVTTNMFMLLSSLNPELFAFIMSNE